MPHPKSVIEDLIKAAEIKPNDKLLDLACGPGRLTIPLSGYFREVIAIDWEKEMIEEGKRVSKELGINNIKWMNGKAEELSLESETFKLITIGDAFHRLDQLKILQNSHKMLIKGGYLFLIGSHTVTDGDQPWQKELRKTVSPWKKPNNPNANSENNQEEPWETVLREFGFKNVSSKSFGETIVLSIEEIIGYLYSMSVYSKNIIGDEYIKFENDIKEALLKIKPENKFEYIFSCDYCIGKKEL
jgi:ubiquinone/menaquinone biosynthesis C-methylase UbiE